MSNPRWEWDDDSIKLDDEAMAYALGVMKNDSDCLHAGVRAYLWKLQQKEKDTMPLENESEEQYIARLRDIIEGKRNET